MHWLRFILRVDLGLIAVISLAMLQCALAQEETSRLSDSTVFLIIDTTDNSGAQSTITGSGVIISPQGHVLTSAHNLPDLVDPTGYRSVRIRGVVGTKFGYPVDLERTGMASKDVDVAILKFRSIHGVSLRAAAVPVGDDLKQGDIVTILGFPIGLDLNVTRGTVTSVNGPSGRLVTDTQVAEGSSGGPAYDAFGRLIGIVSSGFRDDNTGQLVGLNLLVPIAAAKSVAAGLSWITASSTGNLECKGRRLEIVGEGLVPNEGAMDPLSREIKPNELSGVLSSRYPWLVINGGKVVLSSLGEQVLT